MFHKIFAAPPVHDDAPSIRCYRLRPGERSISRTAFLATPNPHVPGGPRRRRLEAGVPTSPAAPYRPSLPHPPFPLHWGDVPGMGGLKSRRPGRLPLLPLSLSHIPAASYSVSPFILRSPGPMDKEAGFN
jgi:hypothetical protein